MRRLLLFSFSIVLLALASSTTSAAILGDQSRSFGALHWRCVGPFRGGRTVAVTGVAGDARRFYFGAVGGGVWRTDNAGQTWEPIFDSEHVASIGAIAVAPSDSNVIYVGTGEADFRSDLQQGNGMYRSGDAGQTWQHIGLVDSRAIGRISVDPHNANDVVVAVLGHPYGPSRQRGVFRSTDGGTTWGNVLFTNADTGAISVTRDPQRPAVLFAAMLQTRRPPWNVYAPSKGPGSGLYTSHDSGTTWSAVRANGFPTESVGRIGIAIAATDSQRVYAIVDAKDGGLYRSDDAGSSWRHVATDKRLWQRGWYFEEVAVDPRDRDTVYISNTSVYRSSDAGVTFTAIKGAPGGDDYHMLWIDPGAPQRMILASDQGAIVSVDAAHTWSSWYNQPTAQLYHVATDAQFPFWIYGAQQDSGAIAVPNTSARRGITQADWLPLDVGGESDSVAPDPLHPGVIFGSRVVREDLRTHSVIDVSPTLAHPGDWRATWTLPLIFSPTDPRVLYFSHQVLFRTANDGATWQIISPDLTRLKPGIPANLDPPSAADVEEQPAPRRAVVYTIAPSPVRAATLWAGTDDGYIQRTHDEGKTWTNVTPPELPAWSKIAILEASHFDADTAYAAIDRHRLDDTSPLIYRTRDAGRTWRTVVSGIPAGSFVNAIREDPQRRGLLYAGTETGVYVSFDDGDRWESLQFNLPTASVRDLTVRDGALVIATHGRSFWVLDDLTVLRQYEPRIAARRAWLFAPQTAYRVRRTSDEGTPLPPETPAGENAPQGALIDYTLGRAAHEVTLDILHAAGTVARHWSSADMVAPLDSRMFEFPMSWVPAPAHLATSAGAHRFIWDLHYTSQTPPSADELANPFFTGGIWAVPGEYRVRLNVDGQSLERPLRVALDPREAATPLDLTSQFNLARRVEALRVEVLHAALNRPQNKHFAAIDAALARIETAVESALGAPSSDEQAAFAQQQAAFAQQQAALVQH